MLKEISPRAVEHKFIVVSDQLEWTRKGLGCQYILSSITIYLGLLVTIQLKKSHWRVKIVCQIAVKEE